MNIESMTAAQRRAVTIDAPEILCVAGPGSGKTTVLAARIGRIAQHVATNKICALTYTNAAARNIEERVALPFGLGFSGTLHGFCLRMLKRHCGAHGYGDRTGVIDDDASAELLESKAKLMGYKKSMKTLLEVKRTGKTQRAQAHYSDEEMVILAYTEELRECGLLDFDMILTEFLRLLCNDPELMKTIREEFEYIFVDEVQDSAATDWNIFLTLPIANKFLVGDSDQAIFGFRGGDPALMVKYSGSPSVVTIRLEENFRCRTEICESANWLIAHNSGRIAKNTISAVGHGGRVTLFGQTLNEGDEVAQVVGYLKHITAVPATEIAVLARTNAIAASFREEIKAHGFAVTEEAKSEMPKDWPLVRAIIEALAQPNNETLAFFLIIAKAVHNGESLIMARHDAETQRSMAHIAGERLRCAFIEKEAPFTMLDIPRALDGLTRESTMLVGEMIKGLPEDSGLIDLALEVARRDRTPAEPAVSGVTVTTIHAAKGREWNVVFLVGFEDEVIPGSAKSTNVEEERRLAFVGVTRARNSVYISHAACRRANWGNKPIINHKVSRFVREVLP